MREALSRRRAKPGPCALGLRHMASPSAHLRLKPNKPPAGQNGDLRSGQTGSRRRQASDHSVGRFRTEWTHSRSAQLRPESRPNGIEPDGSGQSPRGGTNFRPNRPKPGGSGQRLQGRTDFGPDSPEPDRSEPGPQDSDGLGSEAAMADRLGTGGFKGGHARGRRPQGPVTLERKGSGSGRGRRQGFGYALGLGHLAVTGHGEDPDPDPAVAVPVKDERLQPLDR